MRIANRKGERTEEVVAVDAHGFQAELIVDSGDFTLVRDTSQRLAKVEYDPAVFHVHVPLAPKC
jgi:hypothetical protein